MTYSLLPTPSAKGKPDALRRDAEKSDLAVLSNVIERLSNALADVLPLVRTGDSQ